MRHGRILLIAAVAVTAVAARPAAAQEPWRVETIPYAGLVGQLGLAFAPDGRGLLSWEAFDQTASPQKSTRVATRDPAGGWSGGTALAGVTWGGAQIHLYARTRALLVARQTASLGAYNRARFRLVWARGRSDGRFEALHRLAADVQGFASAANRPGDALVAWTDRPTGRLKVAERRPGGSFGAPRTFPADEAPTAAAMNARGDRVLAWWGRDGVYARIRRAGHGWGSALRAAPVATHSEGTLRATITPAGVVVLAWADADVRESAPVRIAAGAAQRATSGGWRASVLERGAIASGSFPVGTPAIPVVDTSGRVWVTWTGVQDAAPAVRLARLTTTGPRSAELLSPGLPGGAVEDAAAGPQGSVGVSWSVSGATTTTTYATLRPGGGPAQAPVTITPDGLPGFPGSRVAFQPLTGEPVVTWGTVGADGHGVLHASVGPPPVS